MFIVNALPKNDASIRNCTKGCKYVKLHKIWLWYKLAFSCILTYYCIVLAAVGHLPPISNNPHPMNKIFWPLLKPTFFCGLQHINSLVLFDQQTLRFISFLWTLITVKRTCREWCLLDTADKRESKKSMLLVWFDVDDIKRNKT